jgi:hypothetical protein
VLAAGVSFAYIPNASTRPAVSLANCCIDGVLIPAVVLPILRLSKMIIV